MGYILRGNGVGSGINVNSPNHLQASISMASATWNTVASHEVFTVTGMVRAYLWVECADTLTDAADGADIQLGYEGATDALIGATGAAGKGGSTISTGELWYDTSPTTQVDTPANVIFDRVLSGLDIGYEITGAALTGGTLVFHCVWEPLSIGASVVPGAGGAL